MMTPFLAAWRIVSRSSGRPEIVAKASTIPGSRTEWTCVPGTDARAAGSP
jgi:hypothetical protein